MGNELRGTLRNFGPKVGGVRPGRKAMKITPDHLGRGAFIYIRQATADQLANNHESRRRQYGLADRARALGWTDVTVIDDDLGRARVRASAVGDSRGCLQRSVKAALVPCLPSRRRAWRAMDATGTL